MKASGETNNTNSAESGGTREAIEVPIVLSQRSVSEFDNTHAAPQSEKL